MTYDELSKYIFLQVTAAPPALMTEVILDAIRDFLRESQAYVKEFTVDVVAGIAEYNLSDQTDFEVEDIISVTFQLSDLVKNQDYFFDRPDIVRLNWEPAEAVTDGLIIEAVLASREADVVDTVPDEVYDVYCKAIAGHAIRDLCLMPKRPWSDTNLAAYHDRIYKTGVTKSLNERRRLVNASPG